MFEVSRAATDRKRVALNKGEPYDLGEDRSLTVAALMKSDFFNITF